MSTAAAAKLPRAHSSRHNAATTAQVRSYLAWAHERGHLQHTRSTTPGELQLQLTMVWDTLLGTHLATLATLPGTAAQTHIRPDLSRSQGPHAFKTPKTQLQMHAVHNSKRTLFPSEWDRSGRKTPAKHQPLADTRPQLNGGQTTSAAADTLSRADTRRKGGKQN